MLQDVRLIVLDVIDVADCHDLLFSQFPCFDPQNVKVPQVRPTEYCGPLRSDYATGPVGERRRPTRMDKCAAARLKLHDNVGVIVKFWNIGESSPYVCFHLDNVARQLQKHPEIMGKRFDSHADCASGCLAPFVPGASVSSDTVAVYEGGGDLAESARSHH